MTTVHTPSQPAQPVTAADLADLAAAVKRLEAGQRRLGARQRQLEADHQHLSIRFETLMSLFLEFISISEGGSSRGIPQSARPRARLPRPEGDQRDRTALTVVGGAR